MVRRRWCQSLMNAIARLSIIAMVSVIGWGWVGMPFANIAWAKVTPSAPIAMDDAGNAPTLDGVALFETHCAGCHPSGGNIIRRGKTLKFKPLAKRHLDSVEAIATLVTNGKGLMSAYGDTLTSEEIQTVSAYVWKQAQRNWKP